MPDLPVAVIGAGSSAAWGVRSWGNVRLFSPWSEVVSPTRPVRDWRRFA
ncbi:MAG: hypothetical protein ACR2FV_10005 [Ornithinimicrobium sp.]